MTESADAQQHIDGRRLRHPVIGRGGDLVVLARLDRPQLGPQHIPLQRGIGPAGTHDNDIRVEEVQLFHINGGAAHPVADALHHGVFRADDVNDLGLGGALSVGIQTRGA